MQFARDRGKWRILTMLTLRLSRENLKRKKVVGRKAGYRREVRDAAKRAREAKEFFPFFFFFVDTRAFR